MSRDPDKVLLKLLKLSLRFVVVVKVGGGKEQYRIVK